MLVKLSIMVEVVRWRRSQTFLARCVVNGHNFRQISIEKRGRCLRHVVWDSERVYHAVVESFLQYFVAQIVKLGRLHVSSCSEDAGKFVISAKYGIRSRLNHLRITSILVDVYKFRYGIMQPRENKTR